MNRTKGEQFAGVTVALITPFRDGEVDFAALRRLVDWHVEQGTDCLSPVGTTGESPTLSHDEHERVIAAVVEQAAGRIKVVPGTGSNSTREAIRLTRFARQAGADGRGVGLAPQAVPALPRHAVGGDQPDPPQGRAEAAGPRQRGAAPAAVPARRRRRGAGRRHAPRLRPGGREARVKKFTKFY